MWRHPLDTLGVLAFNGILMTIIWLLLPRSWFFTFTGPSGYAFALASWMYADVTATNILATDRDRILALLDDESALRTTLRAKQTALWLMVAPLSTCAAVVCGFLERDWRYTTLVVAAVAVVPVGALAISALVGVMFPYHQQPLAWRWNERRRFRPVVLRWAVLVLIPYVVYPIAAQLIFAVPVGLMWLVAHVDTSTRIRTEVFAVCLILSAILSFAGWWYANRFAVRWIDRHKTVLRDYLLDRERG